MLSKSTCLCFCLKNKKSVYCFSAVSVKAEGNGHVLAGAAAVLVCVTSDLSGTKPVITKWTKGPSEALPRDSKRLIFRDSKREFTIINLKKSDEGYYYCHADTTSGHLSNREYLYVIGTEFS